VLRLHGGGDNATEEESLHNHCSDAENSVSSSSSHSSMPAACYCDSSSDDDDRVDDSPGPVDGIDDDYIPVVIADKPIALVDDASSDGQSDNGNDDLGKYHKSVLIIS
jgi:hypothetical protein